MMFALFCMSYVLFHLELHSIRWQWTKDFLRQRKFSFRSFYIIFSLFLAFCIKGNFLMDVHLFWWKCCWQVTVLFCIFHALENKSEQYLLAFFIIHYWHIQCHKWFLPGQGVSYLLFKESCHQCYTTYLLI